MAETKGASGRKPGMTIDTKLVRQLADVLAVKAILVDNAQPVEFDQPLVVVA